MRLKPTTWSKTYVAEYYGDSKVEITEQLIMGLQKGKNAGSNCKLKI